MTPYEYIIEYQDAPFYHLAQNYIEWIISPDAQLSCGGYHGIYKQIEKNHWLYDGHIKAHDIKNFIFSSKPNKNYMLPTKENLEKTYKDFPEQREFLKSLFGNSFLSPEMIELLKKDNEIEELRSKLKIYEADLRRVKNEKS